MRNVMRCAAAMIVLRVLSSPLSVLLPSQSYTDFEWVLSVLFSTLVQVTIPALVKIVLMDAVTLIAPLFLWLRRNWARIVSIILSILGALGGLFSFYGSVILFNSVDVQALSGADLAHFIFVLVLVNLPTICQGVIAVLLFSPGMRR